MKKKLIILGLFLGIIGLSKFIQANTVLEDIDKFLAILEEKSTLMPWAPESLIGSFMSYQLESQIYVHLAHNRQDDAIIIMVLMGGQNYIKKLPRASASAESIIKIVEELVDQACEKQVREAVKDLGY